MQWKLGHVVAVVVALGAGWVLGATLGGADGPGEPGTRAGIEPADEDGGGIEGDGPSLEDLPQLVLGRGPEGEADRLWLHPAGGDLSEIEAPKGTRFGIGRVAWVKYCPAWGDCVPCEGKDPDECVDPKPPPNPDPGSRLVDPVNVILQDPRAMP